MYFHVRKLYYNTLGTFWLQMPNRSVIADEVAVASHPDEIDVSHADQALPTKHQLKGRWHL